MHFSIDRTVHTTAFDKPVVDHWLERKIAQTAAGSDYPEWHKPLHQAQVKYCLFYNLFGSLIKYGIYIYYYCLILKGANVGGGG